MRDLLLKIKFRRVTQIEKEIDRLDDILEEKRSGFDYSLPYDEYVKVGKEEMKQISKLSRELRLIEPYELSDLPDYGDVMSLESFIGNVKSGGFIDYDGFGNYVINGKMSNIMILPSDIQHNSIRKDFDTIVWFNR